MSEFLKGRAGATPGHAKACQCKGCVKTKVARQLAKIHDDTRLIPGSADATVAVRAHWRRQNNHLRKQPLVRDALKEALAQLIRRG